MKAITTVRRVLSIGLTWTIVWLAFWAIVAVVIGIFVLFIAVEAARLREFRASVRAG